MPRRVDDAAVLAAIAAGMTDEAAAEAAGCSAVTIRRRRADPNVQAELRAARSESLRRNLDRLSGLVSLAISRVEAALHDDETPAAVVVSALRAAVAAHADYHERADLTARLDALEAALADRRGAPLRAIR